ncbi:MAG: anaerobic ribonucleoside-triphosphate reductase [Synergistetes bacterium]|nr:MAG: Anaerobic ribonucleoside-triphosphate reductase [bacterium 42_11]MBC7332319.1 anaerobic ribonucleoside-triphosphate reductase [Synergistota bacterium]MDK2871974.1 hypothetical protein [bacterium]
MAKSLNLFELGETTDKALLVEAISREETSSWDPRRIYEALIREAKVEPLIAHQITKEVEETLLNSGIKRITTAFIRELVNVKLFEHGLPGRIMDHARVGMPIYDVEEVIFFPNKENSNTSHNPESINLTLAETILKEYALKKVFSPDVADAHLEGDIHVHDLGMVNRPYCSGQSPAYVVKFGLNIPSITSVSYPARHAEVLLAHLLKMTSVLQNHFAGAIGWDAVNVFFAPFVEGRSDKEVKQLAQMLIFEFNQLAGGRGGQVAFTDINLYWEIPAHFRDVPALGPGGKPTGKTYGEYLEESQRFLRALFEVYLEGDAQGKPFFFPKPLLHITEDFFKTPGWENFLELACKVASEKGNTYFVFDRGGQAKLSECCRLQFELTEEDLREASTPWKMRFSALQNVTINLPRIAYKAKTKEDIFKEIDKAMELAVLAHLQKRDFIKKLLSMGPSSPLSLLLIDHDGEPYLRWNKVSFLIGLLGLNEMVQYWTGKELHESEESYNLGLTVVNYMSMKCQEFGEKFNIRLVLEQTPAESTAYRLARLDLKHYPDKASQVVKGNIQTGGIYYTNSTHLNYSADINPIDRVIKEGVFHPLIKAGAITHIWMGEHKPDPKALAKFVERTFRGSQNTQIAFSPEFTICLDCMKTTRGLSESCPYCGSKNVDGITRITGYFTRTSSWNKGKRAELKDRRRVKIA